MGNDRLIHAAPILFTILVEISAVLAIYDECRGDLLIFVFFWHKQLVSLLWSHRVPCSLISKASFGFDFVICEWYEVEFF